MFDKYQYWCTRATFCDQQQDRSDIDFKGSTNEYSKIFKKYREKIEKHFNMFDTNINIGVHGPRFVTSRTDQILTKVVGGGSWPPHIAPKY